MLESRVPLGAMADWCRSLGSSLSSGISLLDALKIAARRGRPRIRTLSLKVRREIQNGADFESALASCGDVFPPLFTGMAKVAGHTGHLPEILRKLEDFFRFQIRLRRQLVGQILWPTIQLAVAIGIIALLIFILGIIASITGNTVSVFGLNGTGGAMIWLGGWLALAGTLALAYFGGKRVFRSSGAVDRILIRVPVLGPCLQALALSRLCFALNVTLDTGMSVFEALRLCLDATDNGAFSSLADEMNAALKRGEGMTEAFANQPVFPIEFIDVLETAERSGTVPEAMERLGTQYKEQAEHRLAMLNTVLGWLVWLIVAALIVYMIFYLAFTVYINPYRKMFDELGI